MRPCTRFTSPTAPVAMAREDAAMPRSPVVCAVCHHSRIRGDHNQSGDLFICAQCQADAKQFIEIQDSIWSEAGEVGASTNATDNSANS
jgi:hypothetical protein